MQHFYDGQIRRYITQTIRVLSNFVVKYGDGTLVRVPVLYGDADRQVASIIRNNSENKINSTPRISVYVSSLALDKDRLADSTFIGKTHIRERDIDPGTNNYNQNQGRNYTVERIMPTPFKLTMKVDIWSANTDQKLQILEQILVLFNPSLELQTSDNYIDWASLTVLNLNDINWSGRQIPVGAESNIDVATITLDTPVWLSPPVKVKHLGVIRQIVTSLWNHSESNTTGYIDGLGADLASPTLQFSELLATEKVTISDYKLQVYNGNAILLSKTEGVVPKGLILEIPIRQGVPIPWNELLDKYPGKFIPGSSRIYLIQADGSEIAGTIAISSLDPNVLSINWDPATYLADTDIDSYNGYDSLRTTSHGTFDAIIDPTKVYPDHGMINPVAGDRFLIIEDISDTGTHQYGTKAWGTFTANANDIIEYDGTNWHVIFDSIQEEDTLLYQTNIYKSTADFRVQFMWNGVAWVKSFEGEYGAGQWRLEL